MKTNVHFLSYLAQFFLEREIFRVKVLEEIKTHYIFKTFFFLENLAFCEIILKNIV